jgi:threonine/homoserine/homoserine lactone efflux protein
MWGLFPLLGVWCLAVVTPGPDFVVVVQAATSRSRRHGAMTATGVSCAILLWATGSMVGLSVLLARLSWLYDVVRLAGAGYLVVLGVRTLWSSRRAGRSEVADPRASGDPGRVRDPGERRVSGGLLRSWRAGFLTNAGNPKAVVFFGSLMGALLPARASAGERIVVIALIVTVAWMWYLLVAALFGAAPVARVYRRVRRWVDRVTAAVLIVLGGRLALDR